MEGSATKVPELNDCDAAQIRKSRIVSRIYVEGYDTSLSGYDFVASMRGHFSSCGEVVHVYIPGYTGYIEGTTLNRFSLIYLRGKGAEEKALKLSGSYSSEGHKLVVEPYPFHAKHRDHKFAPTRYADNKKRHVIFVGGYKAALNSDYNLEYVKRMLLQERSKCGRVLDIDLHEIWEGRSLSRYAFVEVEGIDAIEKLLQLDGCEVEGLECIHSYRVAPPVKDVPNSGNSSRTTRVMVATASLPKPPSVGYLLPFPWKCRVDRSRTGYLCIWNSETGRIHYVRERSISSSEIIYAPKDPNLPEPWKGLVDESNQYLYFWNKETNVTQYKRP
ncbi:unnamed protein product [Microthlaspi erraticum]|uniref:WW domain-containing protein n=1 Tax=Microthlaspi erraticum TaxID=1685480 RepID=A0A6D2I7H1_9BRAS|nr:unnamed protein product [Microthlaspi erraticum]